MVHGFVLGRAGCIIIALLSTVNVVHHYFHGPQSMTAIHVHKSIEEYWIPPRIGTGAGGSHDRR
jgi:hypothetical protein